MEFSSQYAVSAVFGSVTKTAHYSWAVFTNEAGEDIKAVKDGHHSAATIGRTLINGPVYAQLIKAKERPEVQAFLRLAQPNFFLPFDRSGINPFNERFPVTLILEGTVRGTGGIRITDETCASGVPGLYAAGDAATRERICGGFTGGGSHNAAWAMSSGSWAGEGAAAFALQLGASRKARRLTGAGTSKFVDSRAAIDTVKSEILPLEKNMFRTDAGLRSSLSVLNGLWASGTSEIANAAGGAREAQRSREAAALAATARWAYTSALARTESRGMHRRTDFPQIDPLQHHHQIVSGIDTIALRYEVPVPRVPVRELVSA